MDAGLERNPGHDLLSCADFRALVFVFECPALIPNTLPNFVLGLKFLELLQSQSVCQFGLEGNQGQHAPETREVVQNISWLSAVNRLSSVLVGH